MLKTTVSISQRLIRKGALIEDTYMAYIASSTL